MPLIVGPSPIFKPWTHEQGRSDVVLPGKSTPATGGNPFNLQDSLGRFHNIFVVNGNITYSRSDTAYPGAWSVNRSSVTNVGTDSHPRVTIDHRGLLYAIWARTLDSGNTYNAFESRSDDDGSSWNTATMSIANAKHPTIETGSDGTLIRAGVVLNAGANTGGVINATRQYPGDPVASSPFSFVDATSTALKASDDTFHISHGRELSGRWYLTLVIQGETDPSNWWSGDDCNSWTRIA